MRTKGGKEVKVEVDEYIMYAPGVFKITIEDEFKQSGTIFVKESGQIESIDSGIEIISGFFASELKDKIILGGGAPLYDRLQNPTGSPILSTHWRPQFSFPIQDVPKESLNETVYFIDYQGVRFISLNSNTELEAQIPWLQNLEQNSNKWTVVTFHHPMYSPASDRDNIELREAWKPLFDKYRVDLILSGHDHTYSRTGLVDVSNLKNVPTGYQQAYDPEIGTVNVVSVSGFQKCMK